MNHILPYNLFESESKNLGMIYHFTNLDSFVSMVNQKVQFRLGKLPNNNTYKYYVSFTRNPKMFSPELRSDKVAVRIVIDPNKLKTKYKLEPYLDTRYVKRQDDEAEERIILHNVEDWTKQYYDYVDILDSIVEINILNKPIFNDTPFYLIGDKSFRPNLRDEKKKKEELIKIELKYNEELDKISKMNFSKFKFPINIVSKYINPKYQDKYIVKNLN